MECIFPDHKTSVQNDAVANVNAYFIKKVYYKNWI